MPANALIPFAVAYALAGCALATVAVLFLSLFKAVPASQGRRVRAVGVVLVIELIAAGILIAAGAAQFSAAATRETLEKPLRDENTMLQQQSQQAEAAARQGEADRQALQQQLQAAQQALAKDEQEKQRLLQQSQNLGKEITSTLVASQQSQMEQLQQQLQAAQEQVAQLKEVNAALNEELATHAVHRHPARIVPTPAPSMAPLTQ